jgi:hypothetical protein
MPTNSKIPSNADVSSHDLFILIDGIIKFTPVFSLLENTILLLLFDLISQATPVHPS